MANGVFRPIDNSCFLKEQSKEHDVPLIRMKDEAEELWCGLTTYWFTSIFPKQRTSRTGIAGHDCGACSPHGGCARVVITAAGQVRVALGGVRNQSKEIVMITIKKILCPVDFFPASDAAVKYAAGLA